MIGTAYPGVRSAERLTGHGSRVTGRRDAGAEALTVTGLGRLSASAGTVGVAS